MGVILPFGRTYVESAIDRQAFFLMFLDERVRESVSRGFELMDYIVEEFCVPTVLILEDEREE